MQYSPLIKQTIRLAKSAIVEGRHDKAMNHLRAGLKYADKANCSDERVYILGTMASLLSEKGEFQEAENRVIEAMTTQGAHPEAYLSVKCDLIEILIRRGRVKEAQAMAVRVRAELREEFPEPSSRPPIIMALDKFLSDLVGSLTRQK